MNIVFDISQLKTENVFLLNKKRNTLIDGFFTKIIYSNEFISTNGIYILLPFILTEDFHEKIGEFEEKILDYYSVYCKNKISIKSMYLQNTPPHLLLNKYINDEDQCILTQKSIKYPIFSSSKNYRFLKIYGVSETAHHFKLTYTITNHTICK